MFSRGLRRDQPARYGGAAAVRGGFAPALQQQSRAAALLCRKMKTPRRLEPGSGDLADDGGKAPVAKPLFHDRQDIGVVAGFGIDDAIGMKADRRETRCEQIAG